MYDLSRFWIQFTVHSSSGVEQKEKFQIGSFGLNPLILFESKIQHLLKTCPFIICRSS